MGIIDTVYPVAKALKQYNDGRLGKGAFVDAL
jgi:hypothetical protein